MNPGTGTPASRRPLVSVLTHERARPSTVRNLRGGWWLAVATVCFGAFMGQLDASIVTLTYAPLRAQFHAPLAAVEWVSLAYLLPLVALLVPVGRLADSHGRKLFYLYGFLVFTAASAACGLAPSLAVLITFRAVQAVGAAMLQANSVALVVTSAPRPRMRAALGVQAAAQALGLALGPTIGGALVATVGWRWVFGINVPIGLIALVAGYYLLPRTHERTHAARLDWAGLTLLATAATALLLAVSAISGLHVPAGGAVALFAVALLAGGGLVLWERRTAAPMIDVHVLRDSGVARGLVGASGGYLVLFGPLVLIPIVLVDHGVSALHAGLVLTALPAGFAVAASGAGSVLPNRWSDRRRCTLGAAACTSALTAMLVAPLTPAWLVSLLVVLGLGLGAYTPANNSMIMGAIPARTAGTGGGLINMTRGLGTALGVALVTLALHLADGTAGARLALASLTAASFVLISPVVGHSRDPRRAPSADIDKYRAAMRVPAPDHEDGHGEIARAHGESRPEHRTD
ncbi:MFS transporter [Pseudofrankia sp. DC12]|uniref:MFS transporter n=1 Tax=Pseudofrankia sp. DC12 TaxID=683315 RepID=UPI0009FFCF03|nr:MFS transporter [Pseudofrankia sp. DC12]